MVDKWERAVVSALVEASRGNALPQRFFYVGNIGEIPGVSNALGNIIRSSALRFEGYPRFTQLRADGVPGVVNRTDRGKQGRDVVPLSLASWTRTIDQSPVGPDTVVSRLMHDLAWA